MNVPTKAMVIEKFRLLIQGEISREDAETWAEKWVVADNPPDIDKKIWDALCFLTMVGTISTDRPYLYGIEDFETALAKLSDM